MTHTTGPYDLFLSYRHSAEDVAAEVRNLADKLRGQGLNVFVDETAIRTFDSITQTIQRDLAASKALLAYFTPEYTASRACQWELTAAFIAAQRNGGDPRSRIFVVNPGNDTAHLKKLPVELRDAKYAISVATALKEIPLKVKALNGTFHDMGPFSLADCPDRTLTGSNRFAGRLTEMWELHSLLNLSACTMVTGHGGPDLAQVSGMGGIGKSLLAEEYALRFGAAYPGGVYWLEAHGSFSPETTDIEAFQAARNEQFLKLLHSRGHNPPPDTPFEYLRAQLSRIIQEKGERCLWVVDDIPPGLTDHLEVIKTWFSPHPALARNLVTTRSRQYTSIGRELPLDVLDSEAALELLINHGIDLTGQQEDAAALVERLGCHAMALDIAGSAIKWYPDIKAYLGTLDRGMDELIDVPQELMGALPSGHEPSIVQTFKHSISKLTDPGLDFLRLAAHLSPAPIRHQLVELIFKTDDDLDEIKAMKLARRAVANCDQLSLAKQVDEGHQVHALVSATVHYLGLAGDERGQLLRQSAVQVLSKLIRHDLAHEQTVAISTEVEHARFLAANIQGEENLELLKRLADFDHYRGHGQLAIDDWRRILQIQTDEKGSDHPDTLNSMSNLASCLRIMGDHHTAKELQCRVFESPKKSRSPHHPDTLTCMNNLAATLSDMGDHVSANKIFSEVLERSKEIHGIAHPDTLRAMNNLATTVRDRGNPQGASELLKQVFEYSVDIFGIDHPQTLICMSNLASTLQIMRKHSDAKELFENVLARQKERLGPDHPQTLNTMNNLASTLQEMGDYSTARTLLEKVLARQKERLGHLHPHTTVNAWNLFSTLIGVGDKKEAARLFTEHLLWLAEADEKELGHNLLVIHAKVKKFTGLKPM